MDSEMSDVQPSAQELSDISRLLLPGSYYCTICGDLTQDLAAFRAHIEGEAERLSHGFEDCAPCKLKGVVRTFYTGNSGRAHGEERSFSLEAPKEIESSSSILWSSISRNTIRSRSPPSSDVKSVKPDFRSYTVCSLTRRRNTRYFASTHARYVKTKACLRRSRLFAR